MIAFTLLYANHHFIKQVQPYQEPFLNNMDLSSSRASLAGVLLGLFFVGSNQAHNTLEIELIFWVLVMLNSVFIIEWLFHMAKIYVFKIRNKVLKDNEKLNTQAHQLKEGYHYNRFNFIQKRKNNEEH